MQSNQCIGCKHYEFSHSCEAFPKKIPQNIIDGTIDHSKPIPKQGNKIVFEPIKKPKKILDGKTDHSKPIPNQGNDIVFAKREKATAQIEEA